MKQETEAQILACTKELSAFILSIAPRYDIDACLLALCDATALSLKHHRNLGLLNEETRRALLARMERVSLGGRGLVS